MGSTLPEFQRRTVTFSFQKDKQQLTPKVLVLNASKEMAKEITYELSCSMPHCSLMYAPTIDLAALLLKRHKIELVIASPILADGNIARLCDTLEELCNPPSVVIVGKTTLKDAEKLERTHTLSHTRIAPKAPTAFDTTIKSLGAELRDRLNNPLQEIVAMAFVAKASGKESAAVEKALEAIGNAAKSMSQLVNKLEDNIRQVIEPLS